MGDIVEAQIVRVNVDERKVDFELVSHTPLATRKLARKKKATLTANPADKAASPKKSKSGNKKRRRR
jgi:hypothetical protein